MQYTFKDYSNQIVKKIPIVRENDTTGFLIKPSPAQLRNYCDFLFKNEISELDLKTFKSFFGATNKEEDVSVLIQQIDIDKFRPIQNYLEGKISNPSAIVIEMTSILIDFTPRPYANFKKRNEIQENGFLNDELNRNKTIENTRFNKFNYKKIGIITLLSAGSISLGIFGVNNLKKNESFSKPNCMQWQNDHFELVDCNLIEKNDLFFQSPIEVYNSELYKLKRIEVDKETVFFKDGKAVVFYIKINDSVLEYYNVPGFHPVYNKPLRPITKYIIKKYIKK